MGRVRILGVILLIIGFIATSRPCGPWGPPWWRSDPFWHSLDGRTRRRRPASRLLRRRPKSCVSRRKAAEPSVNRRAVAHR
jgi:hypothetical protein